MNKVKIPFACLWRKAVNVANNLGNTERIFQSLSEPSTFLAVAAG
jgi:hypothetical protein